MTPIQKMVLLGEVVLQSKIALRAAERLQAANQATDFDQVEVWSSIQSILVAAGNICKILWPMMKKHRSRGEKLQKMLKIDDDNPLHDRSFRNHFEHYDERVEDWVSNQSSKVYIDLSTNPSLRAPSMPMSDHRGYNSFNNTLLFRGEILDLNEVLNALKEILENCKPYVLT